jgi:hypothetical protein
MRTVLERLAAGPKKTAATMAGAEVMAIAAVLLGLGYYYYSVLFPNLGTEYDLWFGTDIPRITRWIVEWDFVDRGHLHPLLLPPLKLYGLALRISGMTPPPGLLPALALPFVAGISVGIVAAPTRSRARSTSNRRLPSSRRSSSSWGRWPSSGRFPRATRSVARLCSSRLRSCSGGCRRLEIEPACRSGSAGACS